MPNKLLEVEGEVEKENLEMDEVVDQEIVVDNVDQEIVEYEEDAVNVDGIGLIYVECAIGEDEFLIEVHPEWSPVGAQRFLQLIDEAYYDGTALYRAVPNFLVQFGISGDEEQRNEWLGYKPIRDDPHVEGLEFEQGMLSFAGGGKHSRTTQLFVFLGESSDSLGKEAWETPFAKIIDGFDAIQNINYQYGDIPPWGKGPEQSRIYEEGYDYLKKDYPNLSYIDWCDISALEDDFEYAEVIEQELIDEVEEMITADDLRAVADELRNNALNLAQKEQIDNYDDHDIIHLGMHKKVFGKLQKKGKIKSLKNFKYNFGGYKPLAELFEQKQRFDDYEGIFMHENIRARKAEVLPDDFDDSYWDIDAEVGHLDLNSVCVVFACIFILFIWVWCRRPKNRTD